MVDKRRWVIVFRDADIPVGVYRDFSFGIIAINFHQTSIVVDKLFDQKIEMLVTLNQAAPSAIWWTSAETTIEAIASIERKLESNS